MDFFQRQDQARRKTKWLFLYFSLAVLCMILMVYAVAWTAFGYASLHQHRYFNVYVEPAQRSWWDGKLFAEVTLGTLAVILCGTTYKTMALAEGGSAVAESMGGRLVASNTNDPDERKLLNVVEEMSIASGVPMPKVYLMHWENGINAFAAGHSTSDAAITVTRGCIKILTRDELQGVIGHEFSHILNGDMRLNVRLIGILFGILCVAIIGRILMSARGRNSGGAVMFGLVLLVIGYAGVFFGRIIQAAVSRQREFLADASSVQFTRNPAAITGALKKIGGLGGSGSLLDNPHAGEASHMFFADGVSEPLAALFETHPPLIQRIRAFEPNFDGKFPDVHYVKGESLVSEETPRRRPATPDFTGSLPGAFTIAAAATAEEPRSIQPHAVLPVLGQPTPLHLQYAQQLRDALPENLTSSAREPLGAAALIYALLLSPDEQLRAAQVAGIGKNFSPAVADKTAALYPDVADVATHARLPIVNVALGALKQLTSQEFGQFSVTLQWLINSNGELALFEFVLQKIVTRHLGPNFGTMPRITVQFYTLKPLVPDCVVVLSVLARAGSEDAAEIQNAFSVGAPYLRAPDKAGPVELLPATQCNVAALSEALDRLAQAVPIIKKNLIEACAHVIGADGVILETEAELLRAVADTLDCPIPPLQAGA